MANYPARSLRMKEGLVLVEHRSWKGREQFALARYYLIGPAYAHSYPYETFLRFMSVRNFIRVFDGWTPGNERDADLLTDFLSGELHRVTKSDEDRAQSEEFIKRLQERQPDSAT